MTKSYFDWPVYGLSQTKKELVLEEVLNKLTRQHADKCEPYHRVLVSRGINYDVDLALEQIPFLPVRLFKEFRLSSIDVDQEFKVLTSSGTTSQKVSQIVLDRETAASQTKALVKILQNFLGKARMPMLIIDHPGVIKNRTTFSARGAGILGVSTFGRDHTYALNDDMTLNFEAIDSFLARHGDERVLIFGFTFMVWRYFYQAITESALAPQFHDALLLHSGGWKKLIDEAVDNETFKKGLSERFNIHNVHNFYGMVEQVGSIFMECEHGRLHAPAFADVLIRDARDWSILPVGKKGLIQVLSVLPESYPGHSLLTEDVGELIGIDDCSCGRLGKTFQVHGRIAQAELRGCSDTHAAEAS